MNDASPVYVLLPAGPTAPLLDEALDLRAHAELAGTCPSCKADVARTGCQRRDPHEHEHKQTCPASDDELLSLMDHFKVDPRTLLRVPVARAGRRDA